jgi:hypothetical protein
LIFARTEGTTSIRADAQAFASTFVQRIEIGLLPGTSPRRNQYAVTRQGSGGLAFRATNWLTAFNAGLNDVEIAITSDGRVRYTIQYGRWAASLLLFCVALILVLAAFPLIFDIRAYIDRHAASRVPGLSTGQNVAIFWAMLVFWAMVWPWIMVGFHKKPLRRLMERIIAEVDVRSIGSR